MLQWWKKSLSPSVTRVRFSEQALRGLRFFVFHKCEMRTNNHSKNAVVRLSLKVESGSFRCCAFLIQFIRIQTYAMFKLASWLNVILKRLQKALTCCCWLLKFFLFAFFVDRHGHISKDHWCKHFEALGSKQTPSTGRFLFFFLA